MNRILQLTTRLASRYEKCGSVPNRSERRRREDANDNGNHTVTDNDSYDDDEGKLVSILNITNRGFRR